MKSSDSKPKRLLTPVIADLMEDMISKPWEEVAQIYRLPSEFFLDGEFPETVEWYDHMINLALKTRSEDQ